MNSIVLNVIATNKYISFLEDLSKSVSQFFFKNYQVTIIVHSNLNLEDKLVNSYKHIIFVHNFIDHEAWPFTTLKRFHYFLKAKEEILRSDYSFYIDVDALFIGEINTKILPDSGMFGTIHPCLKEGCGTPERNPDSKAYIPFGSNNRYFCGGFFGGSSDEFIRMSESIYADIEDDLSRGIIAIWHDESHLNRYFYHHPPALVFDNPFAIAENITDIKNDSAVLFLDKSIRGGHDFFRN